MHSLRVDALESRVTDRRRMTAAAAAPRTPPFANTEGFAFSVLASDNVDGTGNAAETPLEADGTTTIDETGKTKRFFRLRAEE